jgi:hypothetical protein
VQTVSPAAVVGSSSRAHAHATPRPTRFYLGIALFMVAVVLVGFWPTYFGPMLRGNIARPWVIQLHGIVYVGWMALLIAQVTLVARGRTRMHRRVGEFGVWYGFLVLAMGLVVSFAAPLMHLRVGEWDMERAAGFLIIPLGDMVLFGSFFIAAVVYRRKPEIHKRLIVLATVALLFAAVGRIQFTDSTPLLLVIWLSPVLVAMGHEAVTRRRFDRVYGLGLVVLLLGLSRLAVARWEPWLAVSRGVLRSMM